jgi:hypothetical protein
MWEEEVPLSFILFGYDDDDFQTCLSESDII